MTFFFDNQILLKKKLSPYQNIQKITFQNIFTIIIMYSLITRKFFSRYHLFDKIMIKST